MGYKHILNIPTSISDDKPVRETGMKTGISKKQKQNQNGN